MQISKIQAALASKLTEREVSMAEQDHLRTCKLFSDIARLREQIRRKQIAHHEAGQGRPLNLPKRVGRSCLLMAASRA